MSIQKKSKVYGLAFFLLFTICGALLLYRYSLSISELKRVDGKLINSEVKQGFGNRGLQYALVLNLKKPAKRYGLYVGSVDQVIQLKDSLALRKGQVYSFFIDPTVGSIKDVNLGVRCIKLENQILYQEKMKSHFIFGWIFIFMGTGFGLLIYFLGNRR